jgi:hypothetical protein
MPTKLYRWGDGRGRVHTIPLAQHQKNVRLARPVVPGSSMTTGQLNRASRAAGRTAYGPAEAANRRDVANARTFSRDVGGPGGFYDQYLAQLRQHTANVNQIAGQASAAVGQLPGQVTGLAQADLSSLQGQADTSAAARGTTAGNLAPMASDAAAVRQALTGSYAAQQTAQNAAAQTYADTLARVVGPTQKLAGQAVAQGKIKTAREKLTETLGEKGAAVSKYREETKASEAKNVLAMQIAGIGAASKVATQRETVRSHKASERLRAQQIRANNRKAAADVRASADKDANAFYTSGAFNGRSHAEVAAMSPQQRQRLVDGYNQLTHPPKTGKGAAGKTGSKGPTLTLGQQGAGLQQLGNVRLRLSNWKRKGKKYAYAERQVNANLPGIKSPWLTRAAADAVYHGHLWANTTQRLVAAGYDPEQVAATLRVPTYAKWLKTPAGRTYANTKAYGKAPFQPQGHY